MKNLKPAMVIASLIACIISIMSIAGFLFQLKSLGEITEHYKGLVDKQNTNRQILSEIGTNLHDVQSLAGELVVNYNKDKGVSYEEELESYKNKIQSMFDKLNQTYVEHDDLEMVHTVSRSYDEFIMQMGTVMRLCEKKYTEAAKYYVDSVMGGYLVEANRNLTSADARIEHKIEELDYTLNQNVSDMRIKRNVNGVITVLGFMTMIILMIWSGRQKHHIEAEEKE